MTRPRVLPTALILIFCFTLAVAGAPGAAAAQQPVESQRSEQPPAVAAVTQDARETRQDLEAILKRLPPSVGRVLRTDPSLMRNQSYLATYPALSVFLQQHPEVPNNPDYYLGNITSQFWRDPTPRDPRAEAISMWNDVIEGAAVLFIFLVITAGVLWLVKTALDYRRWARMVRLQSETHAKLLDRLTANEDLLAYIQTPAGRKFFESAPLPIEPAAQPPAAPFNRILWSLQAGLVLAAGAVGLLFTSGRVIEEVAQVFFAAGVLALAIGAGFVLSAAASLLLSRRLGLLGSPAPREHSGVAGADLRG